MNIVVTIEINEDVLFAMQKEPDSFAREMKLAAAIKWYEIGEISQDKAAEIAGISRSEFIFSLNRYKVTPFQESLKDVMSEIKEE